MSKTTLNIRIDSQIKKDAEKVLKEIGISTSSAIAIYMKKIARERGLPFELKLKGSKLSNHKTTGATHSDDDYFDDLDLDGSESVRRAIDKL